MMILISLLAFACSFLFSVDAQSFCTSGSNFNTPSTRSCMSGWSKGNSYSYPNDFQGILNDVTIYTCPTSDKRIIVSNGIPDHDVFQGNPNSLCEIKWAVTMPLNPTVANTATELGTRGIIAMAINGVPAYGPQEGGSSNAVEPSSGSLITDAQYWYGHAAQNNDWHVHNPYLGQQNPSEDDLLGYSLDGFPIYGPLTDDSSLDDCNGLTVGGVYRYHVRETSQVNGNASYCKSNTDPSINWNYILGCYSGTLDNTSVVNSDNVSIPNDCVVEENSTPAPTISPVASVTSSPTEPPVVSPTAPTPTASTQCNDSTVRFKVEWNGAPIRRYCTWVANKQTEARCAVEGVSAICADTCGTCSVCQDSTLRMKLSYNGKNIMRSCIWIANKQTVARCALDGVADACRATCGKC